MAIVLTGDQIHVYRMCTLREALKMEIAGMKRRHGPSAYSIIKKEFNLRGTRHSVLEQFTAMCEHAKQGGHQ